MLYPQAPRLEVVDVLHGRPVPDPYRPLEDAGSEETQRWSEAQDALAREALDASPGRELLWNRLRELLPGFIGLPEAAGGRTFFLRRDPEQEHPVYVVREPDGRERVLIDPAAIDPTLTTTLDGVFPSKEGELLAYLLSEGGREESVLRVLRVGTGEVVDGPIVLGRGAHCAWRARGEELLYVGRLPDWELPDGEEQFHRRVWRRQLGSSGPSDRSCDQLLFGEGRDKTAYYGLRTSPDGRWLTVSVALGTAPRNDLYLFDLDGDGGFATIQEGVDALVWGQVEHDGRLYLLTDRGAPRRRLCVTTTDRPGVGDWHDLLPATDDVLTSYTVTADAVVAVRDRDVVSRVSVHDRDTGAWRIDLALPGLGQAQVTSRPNGGDDVWIGYTDHVTPFRVLHHRVGTDAPMTPWADPPGAVSIHVVGAEQIFFESKDGTRIPMFVVSHEGFPKDGDRPTILYGYGGFNVALSPAYASSILTWVERGGVYAIANLRGGSEYGEDWHRAGMRAHKQNVFDDFIAAAEWLIASGYTRPEKLGISGGSNGGLLVGAAITQRPDLFRAAVCSAPLLDMVRYEHFGLGQTWNDEYGRADDATEFEWLLAYSPYHRVVPGTPYPAVLFTVFDGDTRVDPLHARKMCAALQQASTSGLPVLIRREREVGHGARAVSRTLDLQADTLSFLAAQLGLPHA